MWLPDLSGGQISDGACTASFRVPASAGWFNGHFPERKIFPGTALFLIAVNAAGKVMQGAFAGASAVKFQHEVGPESDLLLRVVRKSAGSCSFAFTLSDGTPVSSGSLRFTGSGS
ncbi:MAG: hypothetical protein SPL25_10520 [Succinivibrionaceae bacterium]|nr:hypothetical protein [Succinivibrionaceae bacterium]